MHIFNFDNVINVGVVTMKLDLNVLDRVYSAIGITAAGALMERAICRTQDNPCRMTDAAYKRL